MTFCFDLGVSIGLTPLTSFFVRAPARPSTRSGPSNAAAPGMHLVRFVYFLMFDNAGTDTYAFNSAATKLHICNENQRFFESEIFLFYALTVFFVF